METHTPDCTREVPQSLPKPLNLTKAVGVPRLSPPHSWTLHCSAHGTLKLLVLGFHGTPLYGPQCVNMGCQESEEPDVRRWDTIGLPGAAACRMLAQGSLGASAVAFETRSQKHRSSVAVLFDRLALCVSHTNCYSAFD